LSIADRTLPECDAALFGGLHAPRDWLLPAALLVQESEPEGLASEDWAYTSGHQRRRSCVAPLPGTKTFLFLGQAVRITFLNSRAWHCRRFVRYRRRRGHLLASSKKTHDQYLFFIFRAPGLDAAFFAAALPFAV
tara:strand:+ start:1117 stop:1521 length:405 start_codon:yes stop_codon:yes gene_type:complete